VKGIVAVKTLYSAIEIDAAPKRVWDILTDFAAYPTWNPFITSIAGQPQQGARLDVRMEPPGGMGVTLHPKLLEVVPDNTLRWLGRLLVPGIFDGEHHFKLELLDGQRTRLIQQERFTGVLVPLFAGSLDQHTLAGFHVMNTALKARAEAANGLRVEPEVATSQR
jgi:hypothetical protein